jgi:hypothetical protein
MMAFTCPLGAERTKAFQNGMKKLHEKVIAAGARIIHLTPPVFDPVPIPESGSGGQSGRLTSLPRLQRGARLLRELAARHA